MTNEDDFTEEESREAAELARALERGNGDPATDAFSAAALIRYSRDGGTLDEDRARAILDDVLKNAKPAPAADSDRTWRFLKWLIPAGGVVAAAGAAVVAFMFLAQSSSEPPSPGMELAQPSTLPLPSEELLRIQASIAASPERPFEELDEPMANYRAGLIATLERQYPR